MHIKFVDPYSGKGKLDPAKDVFNFHLSQLRIRVEQSFGMLVNKWRAFKKPLQVKLNIAPIIIDVAARLHNFCINMRDSASPIYDKDPSTYIPDYDEYIGASEEDDAEILEKSQLRMNLTTLIREQAIMRPAYNRAHNEIQR
jgi:hypothetical protein